jgi:hypothetical protein
VVPEGYDPLAPTAYKVAVLGPRELSLWSYTGSRKMDPPVPIPAGTPLDRMPWPVLDGGGNTWLALQPDATAGELVAFEAVQGQTPAWGNAAAAPVLVPSLAAPPASASRELPPLPEDPLMSISSWSTYDGASKHGDALGLRAARCELLTPAFLSSHQPSTWMVFMAAIDQAGHPTRLWHVLGHLDPLIEACITQAVLDAVLPYQYRSRVIPLEVDPMTSHAYLVVSSWTTVLHLSDSDTAALDKALRARQDAILNECYAPVLRADRSARTTDTLEVQIASGVLTAAQPKDVENPAAAACAARLLAGTTLPKLHAELPAHFPVDVELRPAY